MFWRFGGYANISAIDTLLEKHDVTLEELLDESDLIQELKSHNTKLIEYLREDSVLEKLLEYVTAPKLEPVAADVDEEGKGKEKDSSFPRSLSRSRLSEDEEDDKEKKRNRYAYVAAEILSSDSWSLTGALLEKQGLLRKFWGFLSLSPPLDPLQASYFTKVNEALLDKKTEEMLELFKSIPNVVKNMLQHVDSPMVMDLLLKIISLEKAEGGQGIVDWLHSQDLMPILLGFLSPEHSWATQTSAGDFLKAIITISANASQNEQSCIGPNELTRQLVSQPCVEKLIHDMLKGGNPLTVGVGIVIEVIRKNNSDYDPDVGSESNMQPSSRDPIYLGTLLRMFAKHVPDFMELILSPNHTVGGGDGPVTIKRRELDAAFGGKIEPLGFDRFKTCELMAELLHCSNMGLLNEPGSEEFVKARDAERERLKSEGKLGVSADNLDVGNEDLTMRSSTTGRLGSTSPDEMRRLEVQNASDDDGFEEVTHADDAKDDFDEKPDMDEDVLTPKVDCSLLFLDKDDEEFVDEPLSSPRLNTDMDPVHLEETIVRTEEATEDLALAPLPLSPSKELAGHLDDLNIAQEVAAATPLPEENAEVDVTSPDEQINKALDEAIEGQAAQTQEDEPMHDAPQPDFEIPSILPPQDGNLSPHPDDRPAPLFSKKAPAAEDSTSSAPILEENGIPDFRSPEPEDTAMGDTTELANSVIIGHAADQSKMSITDALVVGDYLKMQFVEHRVVPTILDFFFRFPWNNFLHNVVYDVVQQVFNGPMDRGFNRTLAIDLFETGDITMRIVDGQRKSDEAQEKNRMRLGYMGHLTLIAEEVVKFTERHPPELLSDSVVDKVVNADWITYVEVTLAETRERDNAILGGVRPDVSVGARQVMNAVAAATTFGGGGSSALADAGLNGSSNLDSLDLTNGNGTNGGSFTLTSGSLLSGFGSSSDEEDEEMDDDNDEDRGINAGGAEFSRYISTSSTTTATSSLTAELSPPFAPPPPPPPLNIPPSRARRQLAARLALHNKQNAEGLTSTNGDGGGFALAKNTNPFADTDSDEEDEYGLAGGAGAERGFGIADLEVEEGDREEGGMRAGRFGRFGGAGGFGEGRSVSLEELELELEDEEVERGLGLSDRPIAVPEAPEPPASGSASLVLGAAFGAEDAAGKISSLWPFGGRGKGRAHTRAVAAQQLASQHESGTAASTQSKLVNSTDEHHEADEMDWYASKVSRFGRAQGPGSSSSEEDDLDDFADEAGIDGADDCAERRRRSRGGSCVKLEVVQAERRTSLEDEDEDEDGAEVVGVSVVEGEVKTEGQAVGKGEGEGAEGKAN